MLLSTFFFSDNLHVTTTSATSRRGLCEANLPGTFTALAQFLLQIKCITRKCFSLKMEVKVMEHSIHNCIFRWKISKSMKDITHLFPLAVIVYSPCKIVSLKSRSISWSNHSQKCHSTTKINLYKSRSTHFTLSLTVFEILTFRMFDVENVDHGVQLCNDAIRWQIATSIEVIMNILH